jgi:tRNA nucleotidyltransferase/poly(A) polymerase
MSQKEHPGLSRDLYDWERELLEVCDLYLVGGTVRDLLLGASANSLDEDYLAAGIEVGDLVARLERFGKLNLVGKSFGVIKFTPPSGRTVDISMPRTEFSASNLIRTSPSRRISRGVTTRSTRWRSTLGSVFSLIRLGGGPISKSAFSG